MSGSISNRDDVNDVWQVFEKLYLQVRKAEQRIYTDDEVKRLPGISSGHPHSNEWKQRRVSCERLIKYLDKKQKPLEILEIGSGNGWFSAQLAKNTSWKVIGVDINKEELTQATRVFQKIPNLEFIQGDIRSGLMEQKNFDVIIFASSIQYFSSIVEIVKAALLLLRNDGEIHILDTAFYTPKEIDVARKRTKDYYTRIGFPEAASYYFHHKIDDLGNFKAKILYNPKSLINKFRRNKNPFYWICVQRAARKSEI